jgi:hypothetical protein
MDFLSLAIDVQSRLKRAYDNLVAAGFDPANLDLKVIQGYGVVTASTQSPIIELNNRSINKSGSTELPGQDLIMDNDGFIGVAAVVGATTAAAVADLAFARIFPYADFNQWVAAGGVNSACQSIFSSGKVSLEIGTRTAFQPRLMRFFEKAYNPQAGAAVVAGTQGYEGYTLLDKDFGMSGKDRNFLKFDLRNSVLTNIGTTTYLACNFIGWGVVDGADMVTAKANAANICMA